MVTGTEEIATVPLEAEGSGVEETTPRAGTLDDKTSADRTWRPAKKRTPRRIARLTLY
jgi:hypothetical protein